MTELYPLLFEPVLKDYIWGGRRLETILGRTLPPETEIAESWEIAAHDDGTTVVANGPRAGQSLTDLRKALGLDLVGTRSAWALERGKFPLLIKILDAQRSLSVQVHPDDDYARAHEGNELGKTEMWVVLHADPGAEIILGVAPGTTPAAFRQALAAGQLEPQLHRLPVKSGDFINVPAGSLHAILGGLLIAEIQQNSNTTYRVYDWNRVGKDGRPRELHVDQALDVINFDQVAPNLPQARAAAAPAGCTREVLNETRYFTVERWSLDEGAEVTGRCDGTTFEIWGVIDGAANLTANHVTVSLNAVRFSLLPAAAGNYIVNGTSAATLLRIFVKSG